MSQKQSADLPQQSWEYAAWDGPRRAMIERARRLTLRERFEEMQALIDLGERFTKMREARTLAR